MGRVEHVQTGDPERAANDLGAEARAAHAEEDDIVEVTIEPLELLEALEHAPRLVEPAEPVRLVAPGPDGRVPGPDPVDQLDGF